MSDSERQPEAAEVGFGDEVEEAMRRYSMRNRRGHVFVPGDLLGALIGLPEGSEITSLYSDYKRAGLVVSFVSPALPEIEPLVESTKVEGIATLRYAPAPEPDVDDVLLEQTDPNHVLYARMMIRIPQTEENTP